MVHSAQTTIHHGHKLDQAIVANYCKGYNENDIVTVRRYEEAEKNATTITNQGVERPNVRNTKCNGSLEAHENTCNTVLDGVTKNACDKVHPVDDEDKSIIIY